MEAYPVAIVKYWVNPQVHLCPKGLREGNGRVGNHRLQWQGGGFLTQHDREAGGGWYLVLRHAPCCAQLAGLQAWCGAAENQAVAGRVQGLGQAPSMTVEGRGESQ